MKYFSPLDISRRFSSESKLRFPCSTALVISSISPRAMLERVVWSQRPTASITPTRRKVIGLTHSRRLGSAKFIPSTEVRNCSVACSSSRRWRSSRISW